MPDVTEPRTEKIRAIDVKPHRWALWCAIGDGKPFANPISLRRWTEDGEQIVFMLDSHNFYFAKPDEDLELVPISSGLGDEFLAHCDAEDDKYMADRPQGMHSKSAGRAPASDSEQGMHSKSAGRAPASDSEQGMHSKNAGRAPASDSEQGMHSKSAGRAPASDSEQGMKKCRHCGGTNP